MTDLKQSNAFPERADLEKQPLLVDPDNARNWRSPSVDRQRWHLGIGYMMAMGICGVVLTAIGSTLDAIAKDCGTTSTEIGTVFVARGAGAVLGAICSARLYAPPNRGNKVMCTTLFMLILLMMYIPFISNVVVLHFVFAGLGFCTAVTDTGCQIMTRKVHGVEAGPWLGANTVVFGVAGAMVPVVDIITSDLLTMCAVISTVNVIALVVLGIAIDPEEPGFALALPPKLSRQSGGSKGSYEWVSKYYVTEMVIGNMVFWLIGGKVLASSYIEDYVADSGVVPRYDKSWALMVVWVMIAVGRFGGLWDQIQLNKLGGAALNPIYFHLAAWIGIGLLGGIIWCIWPKSSVCFWAAICFYGFGNGPCVGYCYDINNRLTVPSETGMSIVMFGLNFGASLVPYVSTVMWDNTNLSYYTLPLVTCISMLLPLPLLYLTRIFNNIEKAAVGHAPNTVKDVA